MAEKVAHTFDPPTRFIAIDWSGAASAAVQRRYIVAADHHNGSIRLTANRTREETTRWLVEEAQRTPNLVAGLDFAFSYPEWFVTEQGANTIEEFWTIAAAKGESWLGSCIAPHWGRPGKPCPLSHHSPHWKGFRRAERVAGSGLNPKSAFQIGGAGSVGTGSLRGIPALLSLRDAGFSIWPFHAPSLPMAIEIYPRSFTGPIHKSNREARIAYLRQHLAHQIDDATFASAAESEDAFDALCSAIGMARQAREIGRLTEATDRLTRLEGAIFPGRPINISKRRLTTQ